MGPMSRSVGRPPETEPDGTVISKSLVNVTIPSKLADFLKKAGINRSKLFTRIVTMLYLSEICRFCFSTNINETLTGSRCDNCEKWIAFKSCPNCGADYDMRKDIFNKKNRGLLPSENPNYNHFCQSKSIEKGCTQCIKKRSRL